MINSKEIFTIPNILSYIRITLIPFFVYTYVSATQPRDYYVAGLIILLSGLTDLVDGFIARKFKQITELGKIIDPIADKLTQGAIIITLMYTFPKMWLLVILFLIKEVSLAVNGFILLRKGKKLDGAMWFGKLSTAVFYTMMALLIFFPRIPSSVANFLMIITGIFLSLSFVMYTRVFLHMYHSENQIHYK